MNRYGIFRQRNVLCRKTETQKDPQDHHFHGWYTPSPSGMFIAGGQARRDHIYEEFERGGLKGWCEQCGLKGKVEPPRVEKIRFPFLQGPVGVFANFGFEHFFKNP